MSTPSVYPDEMVMYSTLVALTRQNVTGDSGGSTGAVIGDFAIYTTGTVEQIPPIIGEFSTP